MTTFEQADAQIDAVATLARKIKDVIVATPLKRPQRAAAYAPQRAAMRALLGDKSATVDTDLMTYATPSASRKALAARLIEIAKIRDPGEKAVARQQVIDLMHSQQAYERYMDSMRPEAYIDYVLASNLQHEGHSDPKRVPSDEFLQKFATATSASIKLGEGYMPEGMAEELAKAQAADDAADSMPPLEMAAYAPEQAAKIAEAKELKNDIGRKWHAGQAEKERLKAERQNFERGTPERDAADRAWVEAVESQNALATEFKRYEDRIGRLQKKAAVIWRDARHKHGAGAEIRAKVGQTLIDKVRDASGVTEQEARDWAEAREVSDSARSALSRQGYDLKKFRADLADFYRFTNGRVRHVSFGTDGQGRANASGIGQHTTEGVINIGSSFPRSVLWHELGHYIEAETGVRYQTAQWIRGRATGGAYSMRAQFGGGYRADEKALPGPFADPYVGKLYSDGMTEVVSMGLEYLSDPHYLGKALAKDPEHVQLVLGLLSRPPNEIERASQSLRDMVLSAASKSAEAKESSAAEWVSKLATLVKVVTTAETMYDIRGITHGMTSHQRESMTVEGVIEWSGPKALNYSPPALYLCKGTVRRGNGSSRLVKGYALINDRSYFPVQLPGATLEQAQAAAAMLLNGITDITMSGLQYLDTMKHIYEAAHA